MNSIEEQADFEDNTGPSKRKKMKGSLLLLLVVGLVGTTLLENRVYHLFGSPSSAAENDIHDVLAARGEQQEVSLPDGTVVWLNGGSELRYGSFIRSNERLVELTGEGYFDVKQAASWPFRVEARTLSVEVLGTKFDIKNYPEEDMARVVVADGAVKVVHGQEEAVLHIGGEADIHQEERKIEPMTIREGMDVRRAAGWTKGLLAFDNDDWNTVVQELARAYDVDISVDGDVPVEKFYGTFSVQDERLEDIIGRLDFHGARVRVNRKGQKVIISLRS